MTNNNYHPDANLSFDLKTDVLIYQDNLLAKNYKNIVKHSVGICNGLLYQQTASDLGVYLLGAGRMLNYIENPSFGILDFSSVGEVKTTSITEDMIIEFIPGVELSYDVYIKLPEELAGKAAMFSLGGMLCVEGHVVTRVSETIYKISIARMNIAKRLYIARQYGLDVSSLNLTVFESGKDVLLDEINSDDFIKSYITHKSSFIITTDFNNYSVTKTILENLQYPGKYGISHLPLLPIISENGVIPNYRRRKADDRYVIHSDLKLISNDIYTTSQWKTANRLAYTRNAYNPYRHGDAYELQIFFG